MRHERDACLRDRFDPCDVACAAFELYSLCASFDKLFCRLHRLFGRIVSVNRHIGDKQRTFYPARHGARMMQHLFERHARCVRIAKHYHP